MADVRTGKAQVKQVDPTHVKGIKQGNSTGNYERQGGHLSDGRRTAEASTGINAKARNPIDPRMPNLPPA
jgi:hypothetical protein